MSDNAKNIITYTASDIEKYLRGELSTPEMHALEKAALDDPFLADALEGMEKDFASRGEPAFHEDLSILRQRLEARVAEKETKKVSLLANIVSSKAWRIAAALILLLGLGLTAYYMLLPGSRQKATLAGTAAITQDDKKITPPAKIDSTQAAAPVATLKKSISKPESAKSESVTTNKSKPANNIRTENAGTIPSLSETAKKGRARSQTTALPVTAQDDAVALNKDKEVATSSAPKRDTSFLANNFVAAAGQQPAPSSVMLRGKASGMVISRNHALAERAVYSGIVTDNNNRPIANAIVYLANNDRLNTLTDNNGLFRLHLPRQDSELNLKITSLGYAEASVAVNNDTRFGNYIRLQPQPNTLNEVIVQGFGAKKKQVSRASDSITYRNDTPATLKNYRYDNSGELSVNREHNVVIPVIGWNAYMNYLEANKHDPSLDPTLRGEERVSFKVDSKGELSSFKILKSVSPEHDAVAIRLIRQGPAWKLLKGRKARSTSVTIFY